MKLTKLSLMLSVVAGLILSVSAFAQNETFSDPNVDYSFEVPDATWKMTSKPSDISPNVEYVYGTRTSGHLEVRKLSLKSGENLEDLIRDEETKLQFKPGFVAGKEEPFKGFLAGKVYNFEFVKSGRNWSGRYYFLKADASTVYVLRFEAYSDKLLSIRNIIDQMGRTFKISKGK
ncbi:MAG: hypothetical protein R2747_13990 [Pyrinomonadaceae bacterium]